MTEARARIDRPVLLPGDYGWSSSLARATLIELRFAWVGDVVGGLEAVRPPRLRVAPGPPRRPGALRGVPPPDP